MTHEILSLIMKVTKFDETAAPKNEKHVWCNALVVNGM